jgi:predicted XRE-type DNA-binding protein
MTRKSYASVWDAISDTPEEAQNMKLRSVLMRHIEDEIRRRKWTQAEAAIHLGITQPRVSDLLRGKIDLFGLDGLVNMVAAMGEHIEVKFRGPKPARPGKDRATA